MAIGRRAPPTGHQIKRENQVFLLGTREDQSLTAEELARGLIERFESPSYQPPTLPGVALELLELARRSDVEIPEILHLLERDAMLAGRVLQISQSPVYAARYAMTTLRDAVVRLGLNTITQIFLEVSMKLRVFRCPAYQEPMQELQRHSMATAHLARAVCKYTAFAHDYAFTCGLLHDVGIAAVLLLLGDTRRGAEPPELAHVWPALFNVHQRASGWLCTRWKLPPDVVAVVSNHHDFTIEGRVHPLAAAVALAEALATRLGHGVGREIPEGQEQRAAAALGLSDAQLGLVMAEGELLRHYVSASASE